MTEQTRDELAEAVAEVWTRNNGWIPGGSQKELEAALGLSLPAPSVSRYDPDKRLMTTDTSNPKRLHGRRETYAEWKARQ